MCLGSVWLAYTFLMHHASYSSMTGSHNSVHALGAYALGRQLHWTEWAALLDRGSLAQRHEWAETKSWVALVLHSNIIQQKSLPAILKCIIPLGLNATKTKLWQRHLLTDTVTCTHAHMHVQIRATMLTKKEVWTCCLYNIQYVEWSIDATPRCAASVSAKAYLLSPSATPAPVFPPGEV